MVSGNLPPKENQDKTTTYFNNFFKNNLTVSQNADDAIVAFCEKITGDTASARVLAGSILYTALDQKIDVMALLDEMRKLNTGRRVERKTQIDNQAVEDRFLTPQQIEQYKDNYRNNQLFYASTTKMFYRKRDNSIVPVDGFRAETVATGVNTFQNTYYKIEFEVQNNELSAYLTMFLNFNRENSSYLGITNSPKPNKYVARAILP